MIKRCVKIEMGGGGGGEGVGGYVTWMFVNDQFVVRMAYCR